MIESRLEVKIIRSDLDNLWGVLRSKASRRITRGKGHPKSRLFKKSQPPQSLKDVLVSDPNISTSRYPKNYLEKNKTTQEQTTNKSKNDSATFAKYSVFSRPRYQQCCLRCWEVVSGPKHL